jgi:hypothetical protein
MEHREAPSMGKPEKPGGREKAWAIVRIGLGLAQVIAATFAVALLFQTGANEWSLGAVAVAGLLVLLSKWLFRASREG